AAATGEYGFVGPDNGVLGPVIDEHPPKRVVELSDRRYARPTVSRTFEGRDRFAPAAAWLAKGTDIGALGRSAGTVQRLEVPRPEIDTNRVVGQVLRVDRFGNLITNIDHRTFERLADRTLDLRLGPHSVSKVVSTYADIAPGEVCALVVSTGHLEIAANGASAASLLGLGRGAPVHVTGRA